MTDTMSGVRSIRINPEDAKFKPGNYHLEVDKAIYFQSEKNSDWEAIRVFVHITEGRMKGTRGQFFLQLPGDPETDDFYRSKVRDIVSFSSACAGAALEDEFDLDFQEGENGEQILPLFAEQDFWAYIDVDEKGYMVFNPNKFYLSDPNATSEDQPY